MSPLFSPVSAGGVPKATVNATTGSPTVNNNARSGKTIYAFNGAGSLTVGTDGTAEILLVGGGGAGSGTQSALNGGGAGGVVYDSTGYLTAGTYTVTVGAGGNYASYIPTCSMGKPSALVISNTSKGYVALGGGAGAMNPYTNLLAYQSTGGGSGAGGYNNSITIGPAGNNFIPGQGQPGGNGSNNNCGYSGGGGGGGYSNAGGSPGNSVAGGAGGNGFTTNINGTSVTYAGGGAGGAGSNGSGGTNGAGGSGGGGYYNINTGPNGNTDRGNSGVNGLGGGGAGMHSGGTGVVIVVIG